MSSDDFIMALFCRVDSNLGDQPQHPQSGLPPSAIVPLALVLPLKGGRQRGEEPA